MMEARFGINLTRNPLSAWNPGFLLHVVETLPPSVDGLFSETHVGVEFVDAENVPWTCLIITTRGAKVNLLFKFERDTRELDKLSSITHMCRAIQRACSPR